MTELEKIREITYAIRQFTKAPTKDVFDQGFKYGMLFALSIVLEHYPEEMLTVPELPLNE